MNKQELRDLILSHHQPELAEETGHVRQIWEDGEITMQKSGELLWQRNLHCMLPGEPAVAQLDVFPAGTNNGKHAYIFTDAHGTRIVRAALFELAGIADPFKDLV